MMRRTPSGGIVQLAAAMLAALAPASYADDACTNFKWAIPVERAVFAGASEAAVAAKGVASAPQLATGRLYALSLVPQAVLDVAVPLGRKASVEGAFGGLAHLRIPVAGPYRISLDQSGWIDVVGEHGAIAASDFSGASDCNAPHKIVQFELPAGEVLLQVTGVSNALVRLAVTPLQTGN